MHISEKLMQQCKETLSDTIKSGRWAAHFNGSRIHQLESRIAAHYDVPYAIVATPPFLLEEYVRGLGTPFCDITDMAKLPRGKIGLLNLERILNLPVNIGMALTRNKRNYDFLWSRVNCGRKQGQPWYEHHILGSNARASEIMGALVLMLCDERFGSDRRSTRAVV